MLAISWRSVKCVWIPAGQLQPSWQWLSHVWLVWGLEQLSGHVLAHSKNSMLYGHFLSVETNNLNVAIPVTIKQFCKTWGTIHSTTYACNAGPNIQMSPYSKKLHSSIAVVCHLHGHTVWKTRRWFCRGQSQFCFQGCTYQPYRLYWRIPYPDDLDNC